MRGSERPDRLARVKGRTALKQIHRTRPSRKTGETSMFRKILFGAVSLVALAIGAAQADEIKEFRIGILGGENEADRLRNYQCLSDQLKTLLGVEKVSLFPAADYDGVIQGLLGGTLDYAELGASGYAKIYLENKDAVEPILTTVQTDGSTG
jgi:phosphonate transport system substrate-binding protein